MLLRKTAYTVPDYSVDEVASMMDQAIRETCHADLENKFQVIVSKRAAQQLVEHAVFMARLEERLARQLAVDFWKAADSLQKLSISKPNLAFECFRNRKVSQNGVW